MRNTKEGGGKEKEMREKKRKGKKRERTVIKDENVQLTAHQDLTLEQALEFIEDDELVEVTPEAVRIRKRHLKEHERRVAERTAKRAAE